MNDVSEGRRPMNEATHPIPLPSSPLDSQTVVSEPAPLSDAGAGDEAVSAAPQGMVIETAAEPVEEPSPAAGSAAASGPQTAAGFAAAAPASAAPIGSAPPPFDPQFGRYDPAQPGNSAPANPFLRSPSQGAGAAANPAQTQSQTPSGPPPQDPYYTARPASPIPPERPERKSRGKKSSRRLVAVALCCSLLGGFVGAGSTLMLQSLQREEQRQKVSNILEGNREATVLQTTVVDTGRLLTAAEVYAQNVNSTVGITTSVTTNFWGYQTTAAAAGSGFILSDDGYILTNYHVIENASAITVTQFDGTKHNAVLIGFDQSLDIAVLKIEATGLSPVILGDSQQLNVGDSVVAIGNPLGELTFSLTSGAVSALERSVTLQNGVTMELIQTDCAINSGNSGGALFNLYGEVIGITNAKYSGHGSSSEASIDNIGFAIPVNSVRSIVESIIEKGYIAKPFIGVTVDNVSEEVLSYGLPAGAAVRSVVEGSPAEQAGLKVGDIITAVDELAIDSAQELTEQIRETLPGDVVSLTVYRRGETLTILVTVGEQVQSATEVPAQQNPTQLPQGGQQPYSFNPFDFFDGFGFGFN